MPKLKTNRAAAKRFRKTAKGWKSYSAGRRHNLGHKTRKTKRQLRSGGSSLVHKSDSHRVVFNGRQNIAVRTVGKAGARQRQRH